MSLTRKISNLTPVPLLTVAALMEIEQDNLSFQTTVQEIINLAAAGVGYTTVQDEGTPLAQRSTINFVGAGVTSVDVGGLTQVTIPGGGASPLTTKGDIFGFDTVDNRIPVGADNTVLTADSVAALGVSYSLVADANIAVHTSTKITITAKGQLNTKIVYTDQANIYAAGTRQDFLGLLAGTAGLNVGSIAGNPTTQVDGDIWYNSSSNTMFGRINGGNVDLGAGAGGGEANTIASLGGGTVLTAAVPKSGVQLQTVSIATTGPLTHSVTTDLLTFDINDLVDADLATGVFASITGIGAQTQTLNMNSNNIDNVSFINSNAANPASGGVLRLGNAEAGPTWRNAANSNNIDIIVSAADAFLFRINGTTEYTFSATALTLTAGNNLVLQGSGATGFMDIGEITTPANPAANFGRLYTKDVGGTHSELFYRDELGTETNLLAAGGQTPILQDVDYDGFDIKDISNVEFRNTTGAPGPTVQAIYADAGGVNYNAATGNIHDFLINGTSQLTISDSIIDFQGNTLTDIFDITSITSLNGVAIGSYVIGTDNISAISASTVAQFNTALTAETFAYIGVANAWGTVNQNIAATGKWQEGGVNISPIGVHDYYIGATGMWPSTTLGCQELDKAEIVAGNDIQTLNFDQTTSESAQYTIVLPRNWNNGTVTATIYWTAAAGTGTVTWGIEGGSITNDDPLNLTFGTRIDTTDTLIAVNDLHVITTAPITIGGSPGDAHQLQVKISRQISDTLTADAKLIGIEFHFTTDAAVAA